MKRASYIVGCALSLGLGVESASADVVTVNVTAHVTQIVNDNVGIFAGINPGQSITGTYSYDTNTPLNNYGFYQPASPPANVTVWAGPLTFQSLTTSLFAIFVTPSPGAPTSASFSVNAMNDEPPGSGPTGDRISFSFGDSSWPASNALPTGAPANQNLSTSQIVIQNNPTGAELIAQIDSVALAPSLTLSPATGSFLTQQNFDAAVVLSAQIPIANMQASANGQTLPLSYPGTCQLAPANNANRSAILCPNASAVLATLGGGATTINWLVTLADGSTLNQSVVWTLIQ